MARASTRISIRWPPEYASEPTDTLVLGVGDYYMDLRITKSDGTIDWSMCGQRISLPDNKVRFTHIIDSRNSSEPDEGVFTTLPNGDDLETGSMFAPHLGKVAPYEEIWREYPEPPSDDCSWILQSEDKFTFLGRIGGYYLALQQDGGIGGEYAGLREDCDSYGKWNRRYAIGSSAASLPSYQVHKQDWFSRQKEWRAGDRVTLDSAGASYIVLAHE